MDDLERRNLVRAQKEKARKVLEERNRQAEKESHARLLRFSIAKHGTIGRHTWQVLASPDVKQITDFDNRPAQKLLTGRVKAQKSKSKGELGPGI